MGLPEELYSAMLEVDHCARRHKIPGLAHTMVDTAQRSLELWRDEKDHGEVCAQSVGRPD